jgi:hypothetical protein
MSCSRSRLCARLALGAALLLALAGGLSLSELRTERVAHDTAVVLDLVWRDPGLSARRMEERYALPISQQLLDDPRVLDVDSILRPDEAVVRIRLRDPRTAARVTDLLDEWATNEGRPVPGRHIAQAPDQSGTRVWRVRADRMDAEKVRRWAIEQLLPSVRALNGVEEARLEGAPARELTVVADTRRLAAVGLTLLDIADVIEEAVHPASGPSPASGLIARPLPTRVPALAALSVPLPGDGSLPLSSLAQFQERTISGRDTNAGLRLVVIPRHAAQDGDVGERVDAHIAWLRSNALLPPDVRISGVAAQTELPASVLTAAVASALALSVCVFWLLGPRSGWRWIAVEGCAVPAGLGALVAGGDSLNVMTSAALVLGLAPAASMAFLSRLPRHPRTMSWIMRAAASLLAIPGVVLVGEGPLWQALHSPVRVYLFTALFAVLASYGFRMWQITDGRPRAWRLADRVASLAARAGYWRGVAAVLLAGAIVVIADLPHKDVFAAHTGSDEWRVRLHDDDLDALHAGAERLRQALTAVDSVTVAPPVPAERLPDWRVTVDSKLALALGVEPDEVERLLRLSLTGARIAELAEGEQRVFLRLSSAVAETDPGRIIVGGELKDRPLVRLHTVANAEPEDGYAEIRRDRHGRYTEIHGSYRNPERPESAYDEVSAISAPHRERTTGVATGARGVFVALIAWLLWVGWRGRRGTSESLRNWILMAWGVMAPLPAVALCGSLQGGLTAPCLFAAILSMGVGGASAAWIVHQGGVPRSPPLAPVSLSFLLPWMAMAVAWVALPGTYFILGPLAAGLVAGLGSLFVLFLLLVEPASGRAETRDR